MDKRVLAVDLGASSGRVMAGCFDGSRIRTEELHRFSNDPVELNGTLYWDVLRLFYEIRQGLLRSKAYGAADSIGVDTWGVDFGLLDENGYLLENPVHYRDGRTAGLLDQAFALLPRERFYELTGNQFMEINTAFQLLAVMKKRPELLERADRLLLMPDLFNCFLCGAVVSERSIVSTTQLSDPLKGGWSAEVIERLGLPGRLFGQVVSTGTLLGELQPRLQKELGLPSIQVAAVAGHDTQCALAAVPTEEEEFLFISCGTWSLLGTELERPVLTKQAEALNLTNETGAEGRTSFLKNIIGLWLVQESRRQWKKEGREYSFAQLEQLAQKARPFQSLIDPDAPEFAPAGNVPQRIREYCRRTGQQVPETEGEIVRCIDESLAFKYRFALEEIKACTQRDYRVIHMVGGGTQSGLLCRFTAQACGLPVIAGPVEATVYGNIVIQLMAQGELSGLREARRLIARSQSPVIYEPDPGGAWDQVYEAYKAQILYR